MIIFIILSATVIRKKMIGFNGLLGFDINDGYTTLEKIKENKKKSDLNEISKEKWEYKSEEQRSTMKNINTFYESCDQIV